MGEICPDIVVESKKNNSELVKAVKTLEDTGNRYIVVFDNSFDNLQVAMEQKMLRKHAKVKNNVLLMDIICFEYILLEFTNLISWIYASDDEFLIKRRKVVVAREKLVNTIQNGEIDYKDIREIVEYNLDAGYVCSDYALIPFEMETVNVQTSSESKMISDYEELKKWWSDEE